MMMPTYRLRLDPGNSITGIRSAKYSIQTLDHFPQDIRRKNHNILVGTAVKVEI
jgi:hypothetical protein